MLPRARAFRPALLALARGRRLLAGLALLLAAGRASAEIWPAVDSDLGPDPAVQSGTLPNGLRYAIRPNAEPRNRVSVRLVIRAGSLHERDDERGLAHFVEHMVFRGTRRHPDGSLTTQLQRLGIAFGPENTAFTHFDYTIYHLELPDTTAATLRQGLEVFREYAGDVTFDPKLLERERGVVLSEKATRDTPEARVGQANLAFLWPAARQTQRSPIGLDTTIRAFTRERCVAFYDAWYRPERMAVVIVGEVSPLAAARLVADVFASLSPRGPARPDPADGIPAGHAPSDIRVFSDAGLIGASCSIEHPFADPRGPDTHARRVARLHQSLAFAMFQRRVTKVAKDAAGQFVAPSAQVYRPLPGWALASFGVSGKSDNWQAVMVDIEREHRRAMLHGFNPTELDLARAAFANSYDEAVRTSASWPSDWIANQLVDAMVEGRVFATPRAQQQDLQADLAATTPAACTAAFRAAWSGHAPHVFVATHPSFYTSPRQIADALNASRAVTVPPAPEDRAAAFAYTDFGPAGQIVRQQPVADLDVWQAGFANGVRLNFKATHFTADTVELYVRVGTGRLSQPEDQPGLDLLANLLVPRGGLLRHTIEELQDILALHSVTVSFAVDSDAFIFSARCARRDLPLALQIITAHLLESAYRPEALREVQASFGSMYAALAASPGGPIALQAQRVLTGGDRRFGSPLPDELGARTISELTTWIEPHFKHGPIELSIVGDTTWEEASAAVASTLAALPPRDARSAAPAGRPAVVREKPDRSTYVFTTAPQLQQVALAWYGPVTDLDGVHHERRCRLLADLLTERLRVHLREELGAAYSCRADFVQYDGFPRFSYFHVHTEVAPAHAERANRVIRDQIEALWKKRFTDDEYQRAKLPFVRERQDDLRENSYWGYTVLRDAQQRPERLAAARDRSTDTASIRRQEIEALARRYFKLSRWFQFVAYPRPAATPSG